MHKIKICDTTLIGSWEEVKKIPAVEFTNNAADTNTLSGLILKGYETKFGDGVNENGEQYSKDAIDDFVQRYFVERKLNMPVDIEHDHRPEWLAGRVLYLETNNTGFYFVVYIPQTFVHYDMVHQLLKDGLLQGFSKEGYGEGYVKENRDGEQFFQITKMDILRVSIVSTPANANRFEKMQLTKNILQFCNGKNQSKRWYKPRYNPFHH